ncbi:hypothetical protein PG997_007941 [Apiospora hydei]|uniref:Cyclin N-terminal domain-containing protein n=1 Tax=Apiospora hydei TaxID=1337664 RepID=A0ABR1W9H2_9PEZI
MGHNKSFSVVDDDFEFDEAYFRTFYKPLSNLPTPPLSSQNSSATQSPRIVPGDAEVLNSDLLGNSTRLATTFSKTRTTDQAFCSLAPAIHLTRMLPPGLALESPSVAVVHNILTHAMLPMDAIALATCILDALPRRYRNTWRMSYPRSRQTSPASKRHTMPSGPIQPPAHFDAVFPEVNVLAALIIANKFIEDLHEPTSYYANEWGRDMWSCEQINVTERCIMEALEYRIIPLLDDQYIKQARHDIELARRELLDETSELAMEAREYELYNNNSRPMSSGEAVIGLGLSLTPADTPKTEVRTPGSQTSEGLDLATREAFGKSPPVPHDYLRFPADVTPRS